MFPTFSWKYFFRSLIGHFFITEIIKISIFDIPPRSQKLRFSYFSYITSFEETIFAKMSETYLVIHKTLLEHHTMSSGAVLKRSLKNWVDVAVFFCSNLESWLSCVYVCFFVHHSYRLICVLQHTQIYFRCRHRILWCFLPQRSFYDTYTGKGWVPVSNRYTTT